MAGIRVDHIVKSWGAVRAVDDISFETGEAEFVALLGPSGCGKSTMLRLIAGLETVTSGSISINDRDVTNLPPSRRNLSMVFQSYALFPHLTVADNITFGLSVRKIPRAQQADRLKRVVDLLGLSHLLDRRPSQLSGGQQQRVALGRALIAETPVCLLDEPLSNLDAQLRAEMRNEIRALQQRLGIAMIFVTHDQIEAMSMADRIILMCQGKMVQCGESGELYERPASTFAARFIGTPPMNILDLEPATDGLRIAGGEGRVILPFAGDASLQLGVRPEHISFADTGQPATVVGGEYFGADTITACAIGDQRLFVRTPGRPRLGRGEVVHLVWDEAKEHFFDKGTGLRHEVREPVGA